MKILLADDHALFREGIAHILKPLDDNLVIIEAADVDQALAVINSQNDFDLALIDLYMPGRNGFDALEILTREQPTLPIVVLSASNSPQDMKKAIDLGAMGYIPKDSTASVMLNALRLVISGAVYIPAKMMKAEPQHTIVTRRQREVLELMAQGLANKLIADQMNISEPTVKMHITMIFRSLGVTNRTQAVLKAKELEVISNK